MESAHSQMTRKNWINIFILGSGFLFLFSAFQTTAFVQGYTISSFLSPKCHNNSPSSIVDGGIRITEGFANRIGYISLCIIYLMVAIGNWLSVSIVATFGAKWSLVVSGFLYVVYIAAIIRPYVPTIFIGAFILGTGGGVLWTAQGQILIQNSSKENMATTSGIFWFMLELSLVFGNGFFMIFVLIKDKAKGQCSDCGITPLENYLIFGLLTGVAIFGCSLFFFLVPVSRKALTVGIFSQDLRKGEEKTLLKQGTSVHSTSSIPRLPVAIQAIVNAVRMFFTVDMMLLAVCFIYTGYELNFWSGVYGPVIGHTQIFSCYTIGLAGVFIGLGEIVGGGLFGILGHYTNRWGRDPVVLLGMLTHYATYLLVFYNLPYKAITENVSAADSRGYLFESNVYVALLSAFLLGFGDACFNTQIYSVIGSLYPTDDCSAPAMALYKFFQSMAAFVGFLTSALVELQWQLLVLTILATLGTLAFACVEWKNYKKPAKVGARVPTLNSDDFKY